MSSLGYWWTYLGWCVSPHRAELQVRRFIAQASLEDLEHFEEVTAHMLSHPQHYNLGRLNLVRAWIQHRRRELTSP